MAAATNSFYRSRDRWSGRHGSSDDIITAVNFDKMYPTIVSTPVSTPTLTESLAGYWAAARFEDLPADTVRLAKRFLIDALAAGIAGAHTDVVEAVLAAAQAATEGAGGSATVWGRTEKLPAPMAAMVNGTSAHALELDDFGGCGHSGAVVIPALCALAGRIEFGGKQALSRARRRLRRRCAHAGRRGRLPAGQRSGLALDRHLRQLRRGRGQREAARSGQGALRRCTRHCGHIHRRDLGISGRRRHDQAFPSGQGVRERFDRRAARAGRHERAAQGARSANGADSSRPTRKTSRRPTRRFPAWARNSALHARA